MVANTFISNFLPRFGEGGSLWATTGLTEHSFCSLSEQRQVSSSSFSRTVPTDAMLQLSVRRRCTQDSYYLNVIGNIRGTANPFLIPQTNNTAGQCASLPAGSRPCVQFGTGFFSASRKFLDRQFQIRVDHKLGEKDQLSGRYLYDNAFDPLASVNFPDFQTTQKNRYQNVVLSDTHIFSSNVTNELRLAYNGSSSVSLSIRNVGTTLPGFDSPLSVRLVFRRIGAGRANNYAHTLTTYGKPPSVSSRICQSAAQFAPSSSAKPHL